MEELTKVLDVDRVEANKKRSVVEEEARVVEKKAYEIGQIKKKADDEQNETAFLERSLFTIGRLLGL